VPVLRVADLKRDRWWNFEVETKRLSPRPSPSSAKTDSNPAGVSEPGVEYRLYN